MNDRKTPFDEAVTRSVLGEFSDIPAREEDIPLTFSAEFDAASRQLLGKTRRKGWRCVGTAAKRVLVAALVAAFMATSVLAFGPIKHYILKMNLRDSGSYYSFTFDPEIAAVAPDSIEEVCLPTFIPEGFTCSNLICSVAGVVSGWSNDENVIISYCQNLISDDPRDEAAASFDAENAVSDIILLGEYEVFRINGESGIRYIWSDHQYYYTLYVEHGIEEETMREIFDSIELAPEQELIGAE